MTTIYVLLRVSELFCINLFLIDQDETIIELLLITFATNSVSTVIEVVSNEIQRRPRVRCIPYELDTIIER